MIFEIAIVEDQATASETLTDHLDTWAKERGHQISCHVYSSGEKLFAAEDIIKKADIFFLDIRLSLEDDPAIMNGIQIAQNLRAKGFDGEIIFLTAFTEYVFQGYEVRAFHYLLKPVSFEPLMRCMDALTTDHSNQCYIFNDYKTTLQIPYNEIICFTSLKHSVDILTTKDIFKQRSTLNTIAGYLPDCFIRCHRSNIVNMKHIYKIEGTTISLSNHLTLQIGRSYLNDVRKAFMAFAVRMR